MISQKIGNEAVIFVFIAVLLTINMSKQCLSQPQNEIPLLDKTYFVDDTASPGGDGSKSNPFNTIYDGLHAAVYGDTVQVLPGTYSENVVMKAGVVLLGSGAKVTTIRGVMLEAARAVVIGANDAIFRGFTVIHPGCKDKRPALVFGKCSPKIFENIFVNYSSDQTNTTAIECSRSQALIAINLISSFERSLLCNDSSNVVFQNNVILNRKSGYQSGIEIGNWCHPIIRNNTIVFSGTSGQGIFLVNYETESNPIITSNIIFNPNIEFWGINSLCSQQPQLSYNDILVGGLTYWNCRPGVGDIKIDPKFVNINRGDFRLAENSPCIDAGNPDPIYNDVDGTRNDMGAFGGPNPINLSLILKMFLSVRTSNISGFPGDTVKVSVEVDNAAGIARAQLILETDSRLLKLLCVRKTILTHNFSLYCDFNQKNKAKIDLSSSTEIQSGHGSIVDIFYVVNPNAQSEQSCPLKLQSIAFADGSGSPIELKEITHGIFVVNYLGHSEHVVYVDAKNAGWEDGSQKNPFNTISEGINHALDGDTVVVTSGVYHEVVEIKKGIFLRGTGAHVTTIEVGSENEPVDYTMYLKTDRLCEISGFTITNKSTGYLMAVLLINAPNLIITNNRIVVDEMIPGFSLVTWEHSDGGVFQGNYLRGFNFSFEVKNSSLLLIQNNTFAANNDGSASIICRQSQVNIIGNRIEVEGSSGISIEDSSNVTIQNNIIETQIAGGSGIETSESITNIINNTIVTQYNGIRSFTNGSSMNIMNNVIVGDLNGSWGIRSEGTTISSYNDVWNHDRNYVGLSPGVGDISANPMFLDSTRSDFHLAPNSPCIDAGNPDPAYNDLDGSRNDMGAFGGPFADTSGFLGRQIAVTLIEPQSQSGDTLCIPVIATNVQGISNIEMNVEYNESHLRLFAVRHGEITQPFSLSESQETPGITQLRLSSPLVIRQRSGSICELIAQVQTIKDTSTVIRLNDLIFKDQVENVYNAAPVEGIITIAAFNSGNMGQNLVPDQFSLLQNYPNPFNPSTMIRYSLPTSSFISLKIYNLLGQEICSLYEGIQSAGNHQLIWDGKDNHSVAMPSGLYFCQLSIEDGRWVQTIKLVAIK